MAAEGAEDEVEGYDEDAEGEDDEDSNQETLVDPMTTSLGYDEELMPVAGPAVIDESVDEADERAYFVLYGAYAPGSLPNDALQEAYMGWLEADAESQGGVTLCQPHTK